MLDQDAPGTPQELVPEPELLDECSVGRQIATLEVREQTAAGPHHLQETAAAVMVLEVGTKVLGQGVDPLREQRNLNLGRTGVTWVRLMLGDYGLLVEAHAPDPLNNDVSRVVIRCSMAK
jgi:hypothetical protein